MFTKVAFPEVSSVVKVIACCFLEKLSKFVLDNQPSLVSVDSAILISGVVPPEESMGFFPPTLSTLPPPPALFAQSISKKFSSSLKDLTDNTWPSSGSPCGKAIL